MGSTPFLTGDPEIAAEILLSDDPQSHSVGGVAVGAGSAWVGLGRKGRPVVVRIDLVTNEIVGQIPVHGAPSRKQIAATDDAVWIASPGRLERIDPATNTVAATAALPGRSVSAIAADASAVWAITSVDAGGEWTGTLVRVDPRTNDVVAEIPLGPQVAGYEDEVIIGAGSVWVLGIRWIVEEDAEYGSDLIRIDPVTNAVAARIPVGGFHMVMGVDEVWVRFIADGVFDTYGEQTLWTRVDVRTNEPSKPFEFGGRGLRLVTPDALWSVDYDEDEHVRVTRFDPGTLKAQARSSPIRSYFHDAVIDPASGTVWISAIQNVVRVDITEEPSSTPATDVVSPEEPVTMLSHEGWNHVQTTIDPGSSHDLPIVWAANVPFSPNDPAGGFPTATVR
jgi:hypothetical protein